MLRNDENIQSDEIFRAISTYADHPWLANPLHIYFGNLNVQRRIRLN